MLLKGSMKDKPRPYVPANALEERLGWTSASSALADSLCQGRHLAQKGLPEPVRDKTDAEFGIKVHTALELSDPRMLNSAELDAYEECKYVERAALKKYFGRTDIKHSTSEHRLWMDIEDKEGILWHSGRLDKWYRHADRALIVEYKTLRGEVEDSTTNMQLRDQAVLLNYNERLLSEIAVTVAQPPASVPPVVTVYGGLDLLQATHDMQLRVIRSNERESWMNRVAGPIQCQFCIAKMECRQYAQWKSQQLPAEIPTATKSPSMWTVEEWQSFLEREAQARQWLKDVKDYAKMMLGENPEAIPGYKLQRTGELDTVTDPQELFTRFEKLGGKLPDYMKCLDVGKGKFKELLAATTGAKGKMLDAALDVILSGIITSKEKEPTIKKVK